MDPSLRPRRKLRTLSFSIFDGPRPLNETGENVAPVVVANRQRRASVTQQYSNSVASTGGLDNLINAASLNASKAVAAQFLVEEEDQDNSNVNRTSRDRKMSVFSGKTPTPSGAPTRKPSTVACSSISSPNAPQSPFIEKTSTENPSTNVQPSAKYSDEDLLSSQIIRDYLACLTAAAIDKGKKFRPTPPRQNVSQMSLVSRQPGSNSALLLLDAIPTMLSSVQIRVPPATGSLAAFPIYNRSRTSSNSSSSTGGPPVQFWFGDAYPPPAVYRGCTGDESDSGASVCSLNAANRDTQVDQLREAARRLDTEYSLSASSKEKQRYGLSVSGSATPKYRGRKKGEETATSKLLEDLTMRLHNTDDLTQAYGSLPHGPSVLSPPVITASASTDPSASLTAQRRIKAQESNIMAPVSF